MPRTAKWRSVHRKHMGLGKHESLAQKLRRASYPTPFSQQANRHHCCSLHVSSLLHLSVKRDGQTVVASKIAEQFGQTHHGKQCHKPTAKSETLFYPLSMHSKARFHKSNDLGCPSTTSLSCSCNPRNTPYLDRSIVENALIFWDITNHNQGLPATGRWGLSQRSVQPQARPPRRVTFRMWSAKPDIAVFGQQRRSARTLTLTNQSDYLLENLEWLLTTYIVLCTAQQNHGVLKTRKFQLQHILSYFVLHHIAIHHSASPFISIASSNIRSWHNCHSGMY